MYTVSSVYLRCPDQMLYELVRLLLSSLFSVMLVLALEEEERKGTKGERKKLHILHKSWFKGSSGRLERARQEEMQNRALTKEEFCFFFFYTSVLHEFRRVVKGGILISEHDVISVSTFILAAVHTTWAFRACPQRVQGQLTHV